MNAWATYESAGAHKLLTPQREAQFAHSAKVKNGVVPEYEGKQYAAGQSERRPITNYADRRGV